MHACMVGLPMEAGAHSDLYGYVGTYVTTDQRACASAYTLHAWPRTLRILTTRSTQGYQNSKLIQS